MAANPTFSGSLKKHENDIDNAIVHFNNKPGNISSQKKLTKLDVQDNILIIELQTNIEMPSPAKGLRSFTKFLLEQSELSEQAYFGSLFRSVKIASPKSNTHSSSAPDELIVMNKLTRLLVGEDMNKQEYFSLLKTLINITDEMDATCLKPFLANIQEILVDEAKKLGY
jgi:hypothetical protein